MLAPYTFIGVGGSGGATLRYLARELERRFETVGWTEDLPASFQFLHIDVPYKDDTAASNPAVPVDLSASMQYLNLAAPPDATYYPYDQEVAKRTNTSASYQKWRTNPRADYPTVSLGAGQKRTVGRVVALREYDRVKDGIASTLRRADYDDSKDALRRLAERLHALDPKFDRAIDEEMNVLVFSSIAGGSGSGVVLDIVEILRSMSNDVPALNKAGNVTTFLYTSEIFRDVDGIEFVHANSLGAMSEYVNAHDYEKEIPEDMGRLLGIREKFSDGSSRRTVPCAFVIGADNGTVTFQRQHEVYDSMAKGVAALVADPETRGAYLSYATTNVATNALTVKDEFTSLIAGSGARTQALGAMGFASVTLGQKLFADYVSENLAARAVSRLLEGHRTLVESTDRGDKAVVEDLADRLIDDFVKLCGLAELDGNDQVIDWLLGVGSKDSLEGRVKVKVQSIVDSQIGKNPASASKLPKQWLPSLNNAFNEAIAQFKRDEFDRLESLGPNWAKSSQQAIVAASQEYSARYGFPLTVALLSKLSTYLEQASSELRREANEMRSDEVGWVNQLESVFNVAKVKEKLAGTSTPVKRSIAAFKAAIEGMAAREARVKAADLLDLLRRDLLPRIIDDVDDARQLLEDQRIGQYQVLVNSWSTGQLPQHLRSTKNEECLIAQDDYPEIFASMVSKLEFSGASENSADTEAAESAISQAVYEVIRGSWPTSSKSSEDAAFFRVTGDWAPIELANNTGMGLTRPSHSFRFVDLRGREGYSPAFLLGQAEHWVRSRDGVISQAVTETLADWLDAGGSEADQSRRGEEFLVALRSAVSKSAPLAKINTKICKKWYSDGAPGSMLICGQIPLAKKHPYYDAVLALLDSVRPGKSNVDLINPKASGDAVELMSLSERQIHPFAFQSFTSAIADDWEKRTSINDASTFWQFRRARPLEEFVPLSSMRQRSLIRGWLIARILGLMEWDSNGRWSDGPMEIQHKGGSARFPELLLGGNPRRDFSALPYVLESLSLAFLDYSAEKLDSLDAYREVIMLGAPADGIEAKLDSPPLAISKWIESGSTLWNGAPTPPAQFAGAAGDSAEIRRDVVIGYLDRIADIVRQAYRETEGFDESEYADGHYMWSIQELVLNVIDGLRLLLTEQKSSGPDFSGT